MKSLLLCLIAFGLTSTLYAQNPESKTSKSEILQNLAYLEQVNVNDSPVIVMKLENIAAQYNIKDALIYKSKSATTYDVVFEESNGKIIATYNRNGEIVSSIEEYKDLKLPLQVSTSISKKYPGWSFISNIHEIIYSKDKAKKMYTIHIKNKMQTKVLRYELTGSPIANYLAVN